MNIPQLLLQLSHVNSQNFWVNYTPGVWMIRLDDLDYSNYDAWMIVGAISEDYNVVITVVFDESFLNSVSSVPNCLSTFSSFYVSSTELYIHTPQNEDPYNHSLKIGVGVQYRKGGNRYINDAEVDDRLLSVPNISNQIQDIFDSKLVFTGGDPELNNADGELDTLLDSEIQRILGNKAIIYDIHPETGIFNKLLSGFVQGGNTGLSRIRLNLKNDMEFLFNKEIPPNTFNEIDYVNIDPKNVGKSIPLVFGIIRNLEIICTNDLAIAPATYNFVVADREIAQIHAINAVYVDGVSVAFIDSLATNSFTILDAVYDPGQTVTADIEGYENSDGDLITNACDVIKFLMNTFLAFSNTSDFYRVWDTLHSYDIYLVINEIKKLKEVIEEVCQSSFLSIIQEDSGAFSAIANFKGDYFIKELLNWDIISFDDVEYNIEKILTSVLIEYNKDHTNNKFYTYLNEEHKEELFDIYNIYNHKTIELNLVSQLDAYNASEQMIEYFNVPWKICVIRMPYYDAYNLFLGYNYKINFVRPKAPDLGQYIVKILGKEKDLNGYVVNLTLLLIEKIIPTIEIGATIYNDVDRGTDLSETIYNDCLYENGSYEEIEV